MPISALECQLCNHAYANDEKSTPMVLCLTSHTFCNNCVAEIFKKTVPPSCPLCKSLEVRDSSINFAIVHIVEELKTSPEEECLLKFVKKCSEDGDKEAQQLLLFLGKIPPPSYPAPERPSTAGS